MVFVTAHDRYALQAFDTGATDYLLKPIDALRLARALNRMRVRVGDRHAPVASASRRPAPRHLLVPDRGRTHVLPVGQITHLEAADNYVIVHTTDRAPLMRRTLARLLDDLGDAFVRCHRGGAVSIAHVLRLEVRGRGDAMLVLREGGEVPCSRQYRATVVAALRGGSGNVPANKRLDADRRVDKCCAGGLVFV